MKRVVLALIAFLSVVGLASAKTFPPVLLSADLENRGRKNETEHQAPRHYALYVAPYEEFGNIAAGGRSPPNVETIARLVRATLPTDRYEMITNETDKPEEVIGVHWGEVSPEGPQPFIGAREGGVVKPIWAIGVGRTHVPPFLMPSDRSALQDELKRDRFYLIISSYDAAALREGKVSIHWQTRTSIDSLQVRADEAWGYLAGVAQTNLAKRIDRPELISDAPNLAASADTTPLVPIDDVIVGASKQLTFQKATPPY
jgi:hypothetical protein